MSELVLIKNTIPPLSHYDGVALPALIADAGENAQRRFLEFFTADIRNRHTRQAYARAVGLFLAWCDAHDLTLEAITPIHVAAYIEGHTASTATVKQHLAAIRRVFDWLVVGQVLPFNPARAVRGPKLRRTTGKTPILVEDEPRVLLDSISTETIVGLRDRAVIGLLLYTWARASAVAALRVEDYFPTGKRWNVRLQEKGGQEKVMPLHHEAEELLDAYLDAASIRDDRSGWLFRSVTPRRKLSERPFRRTRMYDMIRRRCRQADLPEELKIGNHSMRGTGITNYLENGGDIDHAREMAGHASTETTKQYYDRRKQQMKLSEIERMRF